MRDDQLTEDTTQSARDRAEIITVIEEETNAWLRRDMAAWQGCWAQVDYASRLSGRAMSGAIMWSGFDEHRAYVADLMKRSLPGSESPEPEKIRRENWMVRIVGDMAWARFDQISQLDPSITCPGTHYHLRILERHAGEWLLVGLSEVQTRLGYYTCPWVRVDRKARIIAASSSATATIGVHPALGVVGGRLCGRSRADNTFLKSEIARAAERLDQHLPPEPQPLVFDDGGGGLSICWITTYDWMIVILFDDDRRVENNLLVAGAVFGLTPAQTRVARQIVRGCDLTRAAEALGVGVATVRTHVKRMFAKVGVNSQAALVRALMSVEAPRFP